MGLSRKEKTGYWKAWMGEKQKHKHRNDKVGAVAEHRHLGPKSEGEEEKVKFLTFSAVLTYRNEKENFFCLVCLFLCYLYLSDFEYVT